MIFSIAIVLCAMRTGKQKKVCELFCCLRNCDDGHIKKKSKLNISIGNKKTHGQKNETETDKNGNVLSIVDCYLIDRRMWIRVLSMKVKSKKSNFIW